MCREKVLSPTFKIASQKEKKKRRNYLGKDEDGQFNTKSYILTTFLEHITRL